MGWHFGPVIALLPLLLSGCSGASLRDGPPPPESCPIGTTLVCTETTASKMQRRNGKFCRCEQVTAIP